MRILSIAPLVLVAAAGAQTVISPTFYATDEGSTTSGFPFGSSGTSPNYPLRTQQIHGDLTGTPRVLRSLQFRRDGPRAASTLFDARTVDLELHFGHASFAGASSTFAANYVGAPQQVFTRRNVALPRMVEQPRTVPAPFTITIPFDTPFLYDGQRDFLWDMRAYGATGPGTATPADAAQSGMQLVVPTSYRMDGIGCNVPATTTNEMQLRSGITLQGFPVNAWILSWTATNCPPSAASVLLLGTSAVNVPISGLCAPLRVAPLIDLAGTSDANGQWLPLGGIAPSPRIPYSPSSINATLVAQVASVDLSQPSAIKVAMTNGLVTRLSDWGPAFSAMRIYEAITQTGVGVMNPTTISVTGFGL